jgi:hypothetical protein
MEGIGKKFSIDELFSLFSDRISSRSPNSIAENYAEYIWQKASDDLNYHTEGFEDEEFEQAQVMIEEELAENTEKAFVSALSFFLNKIEVSLVKRNFSYSFSSEDWVQSYKLLSAMIFECGEVIDFHRYSDVEEAVVNNLYWLESWSKKFSSSSLEDLFSREVEKIFR